MSSFLLCFSILIASVAAITQGIIGLNLPPQNVPSNVTLSSQGFLTVTAGSATFITQTSGSNLVYTVGGSSSPLRITTLDLALNLPNSANPNLPIVLTLADTFQNPFVFNSGKNNSNDPTDPVFFPPPYDNFIAVQTGPTTMQFLLATGSVASSQYITAGLMTTVGTVYIFDIGLSYNLVV